MTRSLLFGAGMRVIAPSHRGGQILFPDKMSLTPFWQPNPANYPLAAHGSQQITESVL